MSKDQKSSISGHYWLMFTPSYHILLTFFFCLFLWTEGALAQQNNLPINRSFLLNIEKHLTSQDNPIHTAVKPYIESFIKYDSITIHENKIQEYRQYRSSFLRKIKYESLVQVDTGDFKLEINPLLDFSFYDDRADPSLRADTTPFYNNTRGLQAKGSITNKISFESIFLENQSFFVSYLNGWVKEWNVVPGQGRVKDFKGGGYDYAWASAYASYSPVKNLNLQFGHGKHFIGEGYRSLLLSDNAFVYPYLKINTVFSKNRFNYSNIYTSLQTLKRMQTQAQREELFVRKLGTFHYFSWNITNKLQAGIFEGIIWKASDNNYPQTVNPLFYNPVILVNTLVLIKDTFNNVSTGINLKYKILKKTTFYGQLLLNGIKTSRIAWQAGLKTFDLFSVKNLHVQAEFNAADPFTYAFRNPIQNYAHYNQSLAHPLGAGFKEALLFIDYRFKDFFIGLKMNYAFVNGDTLNTNSGSNIFLPDNLAISSGTTTKDLIWHEISWGYMINRKTNLKLMAGIMKRMSTDAKFKESKILFVALRTDLFNRYYDF